MSKRAQILNNLLFLADIYAHRASVFLKTAQLTSHEVPLEPVPQQLPPDLSSFFDSVSMSALREYCADHGVNNQDMIDWLNNNQTVLKQYNCSWDYDGEGFVGSKGHGESYGHYKISTKSLNFDKWEPVAFLRDNGNMRPMKIYKEKEDSERIPLSSFTKEIGHYGFLVLMLHKLLYIEGADLPRITKYFINQNSSKLAKIRSQFQMEPRELGAGVDGLAFTIGPHRVLKFFKSKYAYDSAMNAVQRLFKTPEAAGTEAMIYDYGELPVYGSQTIYYYIIEKMAPLDKVMDNHLISSLLDVIISNIYSRSQFTVWRDQLQDPKNISLISKDIKTKAKIAESEIRLTRPDLIRSLEDEIPNVESKVEDFFPQEKEKLNAAGKSFKINPNWLLKLIEEMLWKYATGRDDLHGGNIGITSFGDFRFFDPAYAEPRRW